MRSLLIERSSHGPTLLKLRKRHVYPRIVMNLTARQLRTSFILQSLKPKIYFIPLSIKGSCVLWTMWRPLYLSRRVLFISCFDIRSIVQLHGIAFCVRKMYFIECRNNVRAHNFGWWNNVVVESIIRKIIMNLLHSNFDQWVLAFLHSNICIYSTDFKK